MLGSRRKRAIRARARWSGRGVEARDLRQIKAESLSDGRIGRGGEVMNFPWNEPYLLLAIGAFSVFGLVLALATWIDRPR